MGIVNGINAGGTTYLPSLLVASTVGVVAAAVWLVLCWVAVTFVRPRLSLFAEFTHPFIYIVAAAYMFSSVYYGDTLVQIHGQAYLLAFPVLFLIGMCAWEQPPRLPACHAGLNCPSPCAVEHIHEPTAF